MTGGVYKEGDRITIAATKLATAAVTYTVLSSDINADGTSNITSIAAGLTTNINAASGKEGAATSALGVITITHGTANNDLTLVTGDITIAKYSTIDSGWAAAHPTTGTTVFTLTSGTDITAGTSTKAYRLRNGTLDEMGTVSSLSGTTLTLTSASLVTVATTDQIIFGVGGQGSALTEKINHSDLTSSVAADAATAMRAVQTAADTYITALSTQRSLLGAYQNQIDYTVSNVNELSSTLSAARSNVQDTDYASETASLTKGQILQQAATAMLAQANQMPNVILSLLK